tara:strand:- start:38190 stop:38642 length:453 start_codon:yes stop_codon:yes gene_type:complete
MKTLLAAFLLTLSGLAQAQFSSSIMSEKTVTLPVDISTTRLKFTNLGYSNFLVKVIVPELAEHTVMNHRNSGEDGPCLFTYEAFQIDDVIQDNPIVEDIDFKITLVKESVVQGDVCKVTLTENVHAQIRGFFFQHSLTTQMPDRIPADCI